VLRVLTNPAFTAWVQIIVAVVSLVVAWWLQRRSLPPKPPSLHVTIYHIVHAASPHGDQHGQQSTPGGLRRFWGDLMDGLGLRDIDDLTYFLLMVGGFLGAGAAYLQWRRPIATLVGIITIMLLAAAIAPLVCLLAKRVAATPGLVVFITLAVVLSASGIVNLYVLQHPVFRHGNFQEVLATADHGGVGAVIDRYSAVDLLIFGAYQLLGVAAFIAMATVLSAMLLFLLASINIDAGSNHQRAWRRLRRLTAGIGGFYNNGDVARNITSIVVLATIAYVLCSGQAYDLVGRLSSGSAP
jgi:hypothetical protein